MPDKWEKVWCAVSFHRHLKSSPTECEICFQDLSTKRTVTLLCGHLMHRTCIINFCETQGRENSGQLFCPICDKYFDGYVFDERLAFLPEILSFGPTGQPSPELLLASLISKLEDLSGIYYELVNTAEWLTQANEDLERAYENDESEEYTHDINDEREKLLHRYQLLVKVQQEFSAWKKERQQKENGQAENEIDEENARALLSTEDAVSLIDSTMDNESSDAVLCSICFEDLSFMRTAKLDPCQHQFHASCIMRWFESTRDAPCCCCRSETTKINGDDGVHIPHTFPFEKTIEQLLSGQITIMGDPSEIIRRNRLAINKLFVHLTRQKRVAIKHKRDERYSKDIEEEIDLLRQRSLALDRYHLHIVEKKELERTQEAAAPDSAAGILAANASENALNQNEEADSAAANNDTDNAPLN